ncbi:hypothetical protein [Pseudomonas sp. NBRC 111127]|uniref:hypothetical protein n=1 Tax=Pseudomonas sp. NBRC 111127 TaxID=1661042 RepID=UPI0009EB48D0|nr:hypothetical protein [Pseudomonas sp. NBRC 111127]
MHDLKYLERKYLEIEPRTEEVLSSLLSEALCRSRRIVISKGALYNVSPYEIERAGFKKGKALRKIPSHTKNTHVYHLDEHDKVIFLEIYGQSESIINKEFYCYGGGCIERVHFTSAGKLRNISISLLEEGAVVKDINWGQYGCSESNYVYADKRLEKIHVRQKEHTESAFSDFEVSFEYDSGELVSIKNFFPNGYEEQRFP